MNARDLLSAAATVADVQALLAAEHLAELAAYDEDELAFDLARLVDLPGGKDKAKRLERQIRERRKANPAPLKVATTPTISLTPTIRGWLLSEDCPEEYLPDGNGDIPAGYVCSDTVSSDGEVIAAAPIAVVGRAYDAEADRIALAIVWRYHGRWVRRVVDRVAAVSRDGVLALAAAGAPVDQLASSLVARWLGACDLALDTETVHAQSRMGWSTDGAAFAWGGTPIGSCVDVLPPGAGEREELPRYRTGGTWEGWCSGVWQRCLGYPAEVAILTSLAAPLLFPCQAQGWTLNIGGPRGSGKTTAQHAAESVWGAGILVPWPRTWAGMRGTVEFRSDLPTILDDTKHTGGAWHLVRDLLYQVAGDRSQVLGSIGGGTRAGRLVRTLVISTGETTIAEHLQAAQGASFRILTLGRNPFPPNARELVQRCKEATQDHYGHTGPRLVRWLVDHRGQWDALRDRYRAHVERLARGAGDDAGRLALRLGILYLARDLAEEVLGLKPSAHALAAFAEHAFSGSAERDAPAEALRQTVAWVVARPTNVEGGGANRYDYPLIAKVADQYVALMPAPLNVYLASLGFDPAEIRRQWAERGWAETGTVSTRIDGRPAHMVRVHKASWDGAS